MHHGSAQYTLRMMLKRILMKWSILVLLNLWLSPLTGFQAWLTPKNQISGRWRVIKERMITFFRMLFDAEGAHPDPEKVEAIWAIQDQQDTQELQSLLGIAKYMAPFIPICLLCLSLWGTCLRRALTSTGFLPTVPLLRKSTSQSAVKSHLHILILRRKQSSRLMPP